MSDPEEKPQEPAEPKHVLIGLVDDDPPVLRGLQRTLSIYSVELGLAPEFIEATNPLDFLDKIADIKRRVNIVLTDTNMPNATGFDLIELMAYRIAERELPPHLQGCNRHSSYSRIAHDTVQDMRMILLSGEYNDSQRTWGSHEHTARHGGLLASLARLEPNPPKGFLHAVLEKPFDPILMQRAVAKILRTC